mmetsp:Transcript_8052/g.25109  ORF Transcript_8052/g.25109 Transcript_8052/m.25109 type:complete len:109 (-) Transcript_8052:499-825(-)
MRKTWPRNAAPSAASTLHTHLSTSLFGILTGDGCCSLWECILSLSSSVGHRCCCCWLVWAYGVICDILERVRAPLSKKIVCEADMHIHDLHDKPDVPLVSQAHASFEI